MKKRKGDAELSRQLRTAGDSGRVEAVLRMHDTPARATRSSKLETTVRRLVRQVEKQTGLEAADLHVFKNLGAFVVCGPPALVRALIEQEEIASAVANRRPAPEPVRVPAPAPGRRPVAKPATKRRNRG